MTFEDFIVTGLLAFPLILLVAFVGPPLQYLGRATAAWATETISEYHFAWLFRSAEAEREKSRHRADDDFAAWLSSRRGGTARGEVDEDLADAQELMPAIRLLIEEEIPAAVKRCNGIHRKMALLSGVVHMQEIALEPECVASRRWVSLLLTKTHEMLQAYPLRLRLEADELIHASIVLRKNLIPVCARCPYIQKPLAAAGERCPAADLIQIDPGDHHA